MLPRTNGCNTTDSVVRRSAKTMRTYPHQHCGPASFHATSIMRSISTSRILYECKAISAYSSLKRASSTIDAATQVSIEELMDVIESRDDSIKSFLSFDRQGAVETAKRIEESMSTNKGAGTLAGMPIAIKDNICTKGLPTTAGSKILDNYVPPYDATAVARLKAAGAVIVGKTNMDEFGMGSSTENSAYQVTRNPWDIDRVPGGSSGGSAAAVAAGMCVAALGSDTGGSIRQPAHFCGIVGLKPTYGLVSRYGLISYASSLDTIGPMAQSVKDAALVLQAIAGPDPKDSTCSRRAAGNYTQAISDIHTLSSSPLSGRRVAMIKETFGEGVDARIEAMVKSAASHLQGLGADVVEISLPSFEMGLPAYYIIALSEASSNLARYDGVRYGRRSQGTANLKEMYLQSRAFLGDEVRRRILMGTYALSAGYYDAYYKRAQQVRTLVSRQVLDALSTADALLCPVAPTPAYKIGEKSEDPLAMYKGDIMTVNFNLAGVPAVSVPCGMVDGLPVGVQLVGQPFGEADLLSLAHIFEQTTPKASIDQQLQN